MDTIAQPHQRIVSVEEYACAYCGTVRGRLADAESCCICDECSQRIAVVDSEGNPAVRPSARFLGRWCWPCYKRVNVQRLRSSISRRKDRLVTLKEQLADEEAKLAYDEAALSALKLRQPPELPKPLPDPWQGVDLFRRGRD